MHEAHETLSPGVILRSRYMVIDFLGMGGFSAVYVVQDLQGGDRLLALKETIIVDNETSERFTFECSLLERLAHPALPRVYHVFDNEQHNRLYMLMDYVEGPNLDTLRLIQHEKRFSFPVICAILAPIAEAVEYLHQQHPPIVHRDIKPSNIIVPVAERKTVLVDFGIAKEYDTQGTTSAVRYGSRGYGAPEQYSTGTNTRTDIYGLGATVYTLLTGEIPPDALERMTQISNDKPDPLKPANELVPSIPLPASRAIGRAMSINIKQRFATAQEFWRALQEESGQQSHLSEALDSIVVSPSTDAAYRNRPAQPPQAKQLPAQQSRKGLLSVFLLLLLMGVIGASMWGFSVFWRNQGTAPAGSATGIPQPPALSPVPRQTEAVRVTLTPNPFFPVAPLYKGTIDNLQASVSTQMILTVKQQENGNISGTFIGLQMSGTFKGTLFLDQSKHIKIIFHIVASSRNKPLSFTGDVLPDSSLNGSFCQIDNSNSCVIGAYGWWNGTPATH